MSVQLAKKISEKILSFKTASDNSNDKSVLLIGRDYKFFFTMNIIN